ncbi:STAS domain-containing protein [Thermomonospora echinospora]|nr:STAS domain-containing protein [Thermomonospora echinospora]
MTAEALDVTLERRGPWTVLALAGALDFTTVGSLARRLDEVLAGAADRAPPPRLALRLADLAFCDSSGVNAIINVHKRLVAVGGRLVLVAPSRPVTRLLDITGLARCLTVTDTLPDGPPPGSRPEDEGG